MPSSVGTERLILLSNERNIRCPSPVHGHPRFVCERKIGALAMKVGRGLYFISFVEL